MNEYFKTFYCEVSGLLQLENQVFYAIVDPDGSFVGYKSFANAARYLLASGKRGKSELIKVDTLIDPTVDGEYNYV